VYPFEVLLPAGVAGNESESIVMPQQVRTISKLCLLEPLGVLADQDLQEQIENRLLEHLGIEFEAESPPG
jgi:mRNA-degrading endonuclease toxin of MazEF toxin-antitoxin module